MEGIILTNNCYDRNGKAILELWVKTDQGPTKVLIDHNRPVFFIERDISTPSFPFQFERKNVTLKSFTGREVDALYFNSQDHWFQAKEICLNNSIRTYESDVRNTDRFLMERFIKGSIDINAPYQKEVLNPEVRPSHNIPNLNIMSFDIETSMKNDLFSIALHQYDLFSLEKDVKKVFMVGENQGSLEEGEGELIYCSTQRECYELFEREVQHLDPDIIIGWHVVGFDLKFLERKTNSWGIDLRLGRNNSKIRIIDRERTRTSVASIPGRIVIDGPPALRGAFYNFESFKLDNVAHELLGERKDIEATGMEKVKEIEDRFHNDKVALAKYNILDCVLVSRIFKKTNIIQEMIFRSQMSGMLLDKIGMSTAAFDFILLPQIHRKGFVAPNSIDIQREQHAAGGFVLAPSAGLHEHVIVLDFKSLYPTIIRTFKIDPFSRIMADVDPVETPVGVKFSRSHHILPEYLEELMNARAQAKENGNPYLSQAIKILMNSFYGVMGSAGSRFYHSDLPSSITGTGQWILKKTIEYFEDTGHEVVYGDTDSVFVKLNADETKNPFSVGVELGKKANDFINTLIKTQFHIDSHLELEFEKYYSKFFLPSLRGDSKEGAKKKYAGVLQSKAGAKELSFSGMEIVRSDWTKLAKEFQYQLFEKYFEGEEVDNLILDTVNRLKDGEFDDKLVYRKRLTKDLSEYTKSLPPHARAAKMLEAVGLEVDRSVTYVMTRRGPVPTELEHDDIDYQHYIEKQVRPIAEIILQTQEKSFDGIIAGDQLSLF
ncbi:MAG: DNA polymerase II [Oligoflexia bacterium]|nr:DNA polymerase II [Oligoflexia bacterium]